VERQFTKEIESLRLGEGATFHGEGILAVTKALLQSGVSYVGGYQGAPVSHLLDVMVQARDCLDEPLIYGPFRMIEGVSRLIDSFPEDSFLDEAKGLIDREKYEVMGDRERFSAWLDELLRQFAAEAKRRNGVA